jgi:pyruvate dehydrogenase E2 component (dihydrolipoamide acetyltransferase)
MPTEFTLPELGENITAGDVVRVLVKAGDAVAKDQAILELETDKATIEVPSSVEGTVKEIKVKQGDKIKVGQVVLTLDDGGGKGAAAAGPAKEKRTEQAKPQPAGAPEEGGLSQAAPGQAGRTDEGGEAGGAAKGAAERNQGTTKSAPDQRFEDHGGGTPQGESVEAPEEEPRPKRGEVVDIHRGARAAAPTPDAPAEREEAAGPSAPAAPSVRRLARELGVEIGRVTGSGPGGRISAEDVQEYVKGVMAGRSAGGAGLPAPQLPDFSKWGEIERKPMSNIRRKTAEHLSSAWTTIPHVTNHDKANITALEALRKQYGAQAEKAGGKMTMTAIAVKIVAAGMTRFPQFNASVDMARQEIVYKKAVHVGVAVDTERGLLVPVIRDADRKGVIDISVELSKVSERARAGKLSLDEMQGGGMSISNLGGIGGTAFTPIVNWPEVAILGISRGAYEPVWVEGSGEDEGGFEARLMLPLSLSYDHRLIDGADAARFLRWVCEAFEQPFVLAL